MKVLCCSHFGNLSQLCKSIWHFSAAAEVCQWVTGLENLYENKISALPLYCRTRVHAAHTHTAQHYRGDRFFLFRSLKQLTRFWKEDRPSDWSSEGKTSLAGETEALRASLFPPVWHWKQTGTQQSRGLAMLLIPCVSWTFARCPYLHRGPVI